MFRQIHCLLDCLSYVIEADGRFDYRPLYLGVWDSPFIVDATGFSYFSDDIGSDGIVAHFNNLYGPATTVWLDPQQSRQDKYLSLVKRMEDNAADPVIVLADLFYLAHTPSYNKKHLPHFVIIDHREQDNWYIIDPHIGWEGKIADEVMQACFCFEQMSMGMSVSLDQCVQPDREVLRGMFRRICPEPKGRLMAGMEKFIQDLNPTDAAGMAVQLQSCIDHLPTLFKRLYGYGSMISFFRESPGIDVELWTARVSMLVKGWENVLFILVKSSITGRAVDTENLRNKLQILDENEQAIRLELVSLSRNWSKPHYENAK